VDVPPLDGVVEPERVSTSAKKGAIIGADVMTI
jgi:hypothetical protein